MKQQNKYEDEMKKMMRFLGRLKMNMIIVVGVLLIILGFLIVIKYAPWILVKH